MAEAAARRDAGMSLPGKAIVTFRDYAVKLELTQIVLPGNAQGGRRVGSIRAMRYPVSAGALDRTTG
jgi:hypothetical protein